MSPLAPAAPRRCGRWQQAGETRAAGRLRIGRSPSCDISRGAARVRQDRRRGSAFLSNSGRFIAVALERCTARRCCCLPARCRSGMQDQLLHSPVEELGNIEYVFGRTRDLVYPAELLHLLARLAEHAEHFPIERKLVDATGISIRRIKDLTRTRGDA